MADEDGIAGCRGQVKESGEKRRDDIFNGGCKWSVPLFPVRGGIVDGEVVEDVGREEVGEFLHKALGEEAEPSLFIGNRVRHRCDALLDVVDL